MFDSKFILFVVGLLILCLVLCFISSDNIFEDDFKSNTNSDDAEYIWMMNDNGELKLIPTTDTHVEGSASAPS